MAYCTATEVRYVVHTGLGDLALGNLIAIVDKDLDDRLEGYTLSADLKKICSMLLTAILVRRRDPKAYTAGLAKIQYGDDLDDWQAWVDRVIRKAKGRLIIGHYDYDEDEVIVE